MFPRGCLHMNSCFIHFWPLMKRLCSPSQESIQELTRKGRVTELDPSLRIDPTRSTDMSITGTMGPEDTIFLKVQITDKEGQARNIYFPFDILNDTAIDVALEMVKELDIDDWEPLKIADMIEEEISSLVPTWKDRGISQLPAQL
ncbi:probable serine/threonine-protein kinase WNK5 [Hibiscus syriacus]|uniref:probable serine/threonine-protein kinase WNK5 n=1 Tax=Hibiscus syriacus TaxID=106335 RepID=UPI00192340E6|nr:probable serine/threonine-protein kinase WNK5 [Hibiscus syriacus]